ncbi:MAG: ATP-binding protein [Brevundimonas sp.]
MAASEYRIVASTRRKELKTRLWMAGVLGAIAYMVAPGWTPAVWYAAVLLTQLMDVIVFAPARAADEDWRPSVGFKIAAIASALVTTLVYSASGAYMWLYGGEVGKLFAMMQFAGGLLHVCLHMHPRRDILLAAMLAHGGYLLGMPVYEAFAQGRPVMAVAAVAGVLYLAHLAVAVRQSSETNRALREAERASREAATKAEKASAAKSEFLAVISHEIRTPMNAVISAANLLRPTRLTRAQREHVRMLSEAGDILMGLLNDVLDFSKIEAGKMDLESIVFDPREKLEALARMWRPRAEAKGVSMQLEIAERFPAALRGDALRLQQILFNLISNAVKFTDHGIIRIEAAWDAGRLTIVVRDSGCGIAADRLDHIFASFEQAEAGTTRRYGGTGLGLAISQRLAQLMGGGLTVASTPGQGSAFTLEARLEAAQPMREEPVAEAAAEVATLEGLRVLAAEDHPVNQRILALLLEPMGCRLTLASNGAEAVSLARSAAFDVIVLDMQMPVMDGLDAAREIRALNGPNAGAPIVALTANALDNHRQAWREVNAFAFLTKPIDPQALAAALTAARGASPAVASTTEAA